MKTDRSVKRMHNQNWISDMKTDRSVKRMHIIVLPNSGVLVGCMKPISTDTLGVYAFELTRAASVRRWGTTKGLGELAAEGPLTNTILDRLPDGVVVTQSLYTVPCSAAWDKWE